jgi:hypothetical protein
MVHRVNQVAIGRAADADNYQHDLIAGAKDYGVAPPRPSGRYTFSGFD